MQKLLENDLKKLYRKTHIHYDIDRMMLEWDDIKSRLMENMWFMSEGNHGRQTCLQYSKNCQNIFTDGCGSFKNTNKIELDYNMLNNFYEGTIFETIINDLNAVRSRFMTMHLHTTYSVHRDKAPRYHIALDTHSNAYFLFPSYKIYHETLANKITVGLEHIPADGFVYEVDTTQPHTFVNAGPDRTHLVMCQGE